MAQIKDMRPVTEADRVVLRKAVIARARSITAYYTRKNSSPHKYHEQLTEDKTNG